MKAIYFEYPSEYNEFFEKLSNKLHEINITDNKKYWCRPFQDNTYIKDNNKKMTKLKISLSPIISEYAITNEKEKEKMDLQIEEMWQDIFNEDEIIEEDKKDKEIEVYINGEKVDITNIYEPLKQGEYFYKENGKWYVHKLKNVSFVIEEDKKIEKLEYEEMGDMVGIPTNQELMEKINEIIEVLNERNI